MDSYPVASFFSPDAQAGRELENLQYLLGDRQANGIIFTIMQKFEKTWEPLSERQNIVVMADEAHWGQYGLTEKVVTKQNKKGELEAKISIGTARIIWDSLSNATYIGFTSTLFLLRTAALRRCSATISTSTT